MRLDHNDHGAYMRLGHNAAAAHTCGWVTTRPLRIHAAGAQHSRCAYMRLDHTDHGAYMRLGHNTVAAHTCGWTDHTDHGAYMRLGHNTAAAHTYGWVTAQSL